MWQLLGNATDMPVKNQYSELLKMSSPCEKLIRRDIARTYPEHEFFKGQDSLGQEVLFNVMKVKSSSHFIIYLWIEEQSYVIDIVVIILTVAPSGVWQTEAKCVFFHS